MARYSITNILVVEVKDAQQGYHHSAVEQKQKMQQQSRQGVYVTIHAYGHRMDITIHGGRFGSLFRESLDFQKRSKLTYLDGDVCKMAMCAFATQNVFKRPTNKSTMVAACAIAEIAHGQFALNTPCGYAS